MVWFEIYVDDLQRAKKFYETVFQLALSEVPMPEMEGADMEMLFFPGDMESKNTASGALVRMKGFTPGNNGTIVYFMSEDCQVEASRATDAGGSVFQPKTSIGEYGFMAMIKDTEGNLVGIHSMA